MQEECEMLRLQLNSINNLNDHNKRGNSLFAEVDDKRQALTTELEMKREKYETLKKCLSKANHDNNQMKVLKIVKFSFLQFFPDFLLILLFRWKL